MSFVAGLSLLGSAGTALLNSVTTAVLSSQRFGGRVVRITAQKAKFGNNKVIWLLTAVVSVITFIIIVVPYILEKVVRPCWTRLAKSDLGRRFMQRLRKASRHPVYGFLVKIVYTLFRLFYECVIIFILYVLKYGVILFFLAFYALLTAYLDARIQETVRVASSAAYAGVEVANYGGRVVNYTLDGGNDYILPIYNGFIRTEIMYTNELLVGVSDGEVGYNNGLVSGTGRMLQGRPKTKSRKGGRGLQQERPKTDLQRNIRKGMFLLELKNRYNLLKVALFFVIVYKALPVLLNVLIFVLIRTLCMTVGFVGGFGTCTPREIFQAFVNLALQLARFIIPIIPEIKITYIGCGYDEFLFISCYWCRGSFLSMTPGMFEALYTCPAEAARRVLRCVQLIDGRFRETFDDEELHIAATEANACPHSKRAFSLAGNAYNNRELGTMEYNLDYHGINFESVYEDNEPKLYALNITSTNGYRRRMAKIDGSRIQNRTYENQRAEQRRSAQAVDIEALYNQKLGRCKTTTSWKNIFEIFTQLVCVMQVISPDASAAWKHIAGNGPIEVPRVGGRNLAHVEGMKAVHSVIEDGVLSLNMFRFQQSSALEDFIIDNSHPHQVMPVYGAFMHMQRRINNTRTRRRLERHARELRRRKLVVEDFCAPQITCAGTKQCVDNVADCPEPSEWDLLTTLEYSGQQMGESFQDQNVEGAAEDLIYCIKDWHEHPSTDPYARENIVEGNTKGVKFCPPQIPYITWRPKEIQFSLGDEVKTVCTSETVFNKCNCSAIFYEQPKTNIDTGVFVTLDFVYAMINGFLWIRELLYLFGIAIYQVFGLIVFSVFDKTTAPQWMKNLFVGSESNMTLWEIVACLFLKSYNFIILFLVVLAALFLASAIQKAIFSEEEEEQTQEPEGEQMSKDVEMGGRKPAAVHPNNFVPTQPYQGQ